MANIPTTQQKRSQPPIPGEVLLQPKEKITNEGSRPDQQTYRRRRIAVGSAAAIAVGALLSSSVLGNENNKETVKEPVEQQTYLEKAGVTGTTEVEVEHGGTVWGAAVQEVRTGMSEDDPDFYNMVVAVRDYMLENNPQGSAVHPGDMLKSPDIPNTIPDDVIAGQ